ncbi:hypothetical protein OY671_012530, partial [Metschnikowia pulcherrima]
CSYRITEPITMSTTPPAAFAHFPSAGPTTRPTRMPIVTSSVVANPIAIAAVTMLTSTKARPGPTAIASMLVAKPVVAKAQNECELGFCSASVSA